jgi:type I restriction enzyme S subunit
MLIRPDESILYNRYLLLWFYSKMAKYQYEVNSHGSTVEHLRVKDVPDLQLPVPPISEQKRIADELWRYREQTGLLIETLNEAIELAKEKKQTLITKSITGKLNLNKADKPKNIGN